MKGMKAGGDKAFVKKSASCSLDEIGNKWSTPSWSLFQTKWQSISKCLVLSWKTGLAAMYKALWLSQYRTGVLQQVVHRSCKRYSNHYSSHVAVESTLYSASEEDLETVCYYLALQEIKEEPKKKQYPKMDLLESRQPTQSASEKPRSWISDFLGKNKPRPGLFLRYRTTLQAAV